MPIVAAFELKYVVRVHPPLHVFVSPSAVLIRDLSQHVPLPSPVTDVSKPTHAFTLLCTMPSHLALHSARVQSLHSPWPPLWKEVFPFS